MNYTLSERMKTMILNEDLRAWASLSDQIRGQGGDYEDVVGVVKRVFEGRKMSRGDIDSVFYECDMGGY